MTEDDSAEKKATEQQDKNKEICSYLVDLPDSDGKIKESCKDFSKQNTVKI